MQTETGTCYYGGLDCGRRRREERTQLQGRCGLVWDGGERRSRMVAEREDCRLLQSQTPELTPKQSSPKTSPHSSDRGYPINMKLTPTRATKQNFSPPKHGCKDSSKQISHRTHPIVPIWAPPLLFISPLFIAAQARGSPLISTNYHCLSLRQWLPLLQGFI